MYSMILPNTKVALLLFLSLFDGAIAPANRAKDDRYSYSTSGCEAFCDRHRPSSIQDAYSFTCNGQAGWGKKDVEICQSTCNECSDQCSSNDHKFKCPRRGNFHNSKKEKEKEEDPTNRTLAIVFGICGVLVFIACVIVCIKLSKKDEVQPFVGQQGVQQVPVQYQQQQPNMPANFQGVQMQQPNAVMVQQDQVPPAVVTTGS